MQKHMKNKGHINKLEHFQFILGTYKEVKVCY